MNGNRATIPIFLLLVAACSTPPDDGTVKRDKYGRYPDAAEKYASAVKERRLLPGMHKGEIKKVMGGKPDRTRKIERGGQKYVMWIYGSKSMDLYLDTDGYLMRWTGIG